MYSNMRLFSYNFDLVMISR